MQDQSHEPAERTLRARVEELPEPLWADAECPPATVDPQTLIRELREHQIELELQNQALRLARDGAELARTRYQELYDLAPVGYFTLNGEGAIREANQVGAELLETEQNLLPGRRFALWVAKEERAGFNEFFRKTLMDGATQTCKLGMLKSDGRSFPVEIQGIRATEDRTSPHQIYLAVLDVTVHAQLEEELRRAQKLEAVGILAGGVAHEFNNILTVILAHAELLQAQRTSETTGDGSAREIVQASLRAANLTRQLLTFSCRQAPHPQEIIPNALLSGVMNRLRQMVGEDIMLESRPAPDLPLVRADPRLLEQVIMILAANSRDAMPHGGKLTIATCLVSTDAAYLRRTPEALLGKFVRVTVQDTGRGIAPSNQVHIFEPFFTTKDVGKGTGLGLSSVYGIVKRHNGWIEFSSAVGQGTAFHVFLPAVAEPTVPLTAERRSPPAETGHQTILVVEDAPAVRRMVRVVLVRAGYTVLEAPSGATALDIWRNRPQKVDLLLTDLVMPGGINGRELARQLQAENANLKVLYTTGYSSMELGDNVVLEEGSSFLQKPFTPRKLIQVIRRRLDGDGASWQTAEKAAVGETPRKSGHGVVGR